MGEKYVIRHRSAIDGKYVTEKYAKEHPKTTVKERDKVKTRTKRKKRR